MKIQRGEEMCQKSETGDQGYSQPSFIEKFLLVPLIPRNLTIMGQESFCKNKNKHKQTMRVFGEGGNLYESKAWLPLAQAGWKEGRELPCSPLCPPSVLTFFSSVKMKNLNFA
jgi:hypothetical protein